MEKTHIFINCHQFLFNSVCYDSIYFKLLLLIFNDHILKYLCVRFLFFLKLKLIYALKHPPWSLREASTRQNTDKLTKEGKVPSSKTFTFIHS